MKKTSATRGRTAKHTSASKHTHGKGKHSPSKAKASHHASTAGTVHTVGKAKTKTRTLARGGAQPGLLLLCPAPGGEAEQRQPLGASPLDNLPCCAAESVAASARLAGWRVAGAATLELFKRTGPASIPATLEAACRYGLAGVKPLGFGPVALDEPRAGRVLGLALPGPHAVAEDAGGWWSWGELYDPAGWPEAVLEEAWEVAWPRC